MVEKNVLGLEVTVDNVEGMQMIQRKCNLRSVKFGHRVWETLTRRNRISFSRKFSQYSHLSVGGG